MQQTIKTLLIENCRKFGFLNRKGKQILEIGIKSFRKASRLVTRIKSITFIQVLKLVFILSTPK